MSVRRFFLIAVALVVVSGLVSVARAELTADLKKELTTLTTGLNKINGMISKKQFDEADELLKMTTERVAKIAEESGTPADDKAFQRVNASLEKFTANLEKVKNKGKKVEPLSFTTDVAPIIAANCLNCHGAANPRSGLSLNTFAGWKKGGRGGLLLVPGNAGSSRLVAAVATPNVMARMPKDGAALSKEDITKIGTWVNQGATFDGEAEDVELGKLRTKAKALEIDSKIVINKPKGTETVSFTKDIAPWFNNLCVGCHSGNTPRGGLSLVTFEDMLRGGDSGSVIIAGDKENSRLFRLVGGLENPRMPQGQGRITRQNYEDLKKWFEEGNVYDGGDPRKPLRDLVPSDAELAAAAMNKLSDTDLSAQRRSKADAALRKALPKDEINAIESPEFVVIGTVPEARLKQIDGWAAAQMADLKKVFGAGSTPAVRGKLALLVVKDKFSFDELHLTAIGRDAPKESHNATVVTDNLTEAYAILEDVGDSASTETPGLKANVIASVTEGFLKRNRPTMPNWLLKGTGYTMAAAADSKNPWFTALKSEAALLAPSIMADDLFKDESYSPSTAAAVGYALVEYMINGGGGAKNFVVFVKAMEGGATPVQCLKAAYNADPPAIARGFAGSLRGATGK
jgi:hypothetical protein